MSRNAGAARAPGRPRPVRAEIGQSGRPASGGKSQRAVPWRLPVVGLAVAVVLSVLVVFAVRGTWSDTTAASSATGGAFGHVHGLAVEDGTGVLFVATHVGLFRIDGEGTAVRVSKDVPDLMGFTAVEPGRFLASGHSGVDSGGPANLGLIESSDGGVNWQTMSLSGSADFHGLRAAHGAVYGYNSGDGAFMVSTDRRTWERRSTLEMGAFVVSPTDPQVVLGVGQTVLQRSADGGRTWEAIADAPGFAILAWDQAAQVWGATPDGTVWRSTDGGSTWQQRGQVTGEPRAIATQGASVFVALAGDEILASSDGGTTWIRRYAPS